MDLPLRLVVADELKVMRSASLPIGQPKQRHMKKEPDFVSNGSYRSLAVGSLLPQLDSTPAQLLRLPFGELVAYTINSACLRVSLICIGENG